MNPKKINTFHANTADFCRREIGTYYPYDGLPSKVGDLVILKIYPEFDDPMERVDYIQTKKYPPECLVLAEVTRFDGSTFVCEMIDENRGLESSTMVSEENE